MLFLIILSGCSQSDSKSANLSEKSAQSKNLTDNTSNQDESNEKSSTTDKKLQKRMVVYTAILSLEVIKLNNFNTLMEKQLQETGGYLIKNTISENEEEKNKIGTFELRIPQESFQNFLKSISQFNNTKILDQKVEGEDVTEEYVDTESRLKAQQAVEARLYDFMKKTTKTDELLQISNQLGEVQAEIEIMKGRMKYLENQSAFSTVILSVQESTINKNSISTDSLNTWERVEQQFKASIQGLLQFFSSIIVFTLGQSPILILLAIIGFSIWFIVNKFMKK